MEVSGTADHVFIAGKENTGNSVGFINYRTFLSS